MLPNPMHHTGPGRKTLYTHHRQIYKTFDYFNRRKDRDRASQRAHSVAADKAWIAAVMADDAPRHLLRWRGLVQKRLLRGARVRR